jgi:hypothetical protein
MFLRRRTGRFNDFTTPQPIHQDAAALNVLVFYCGCGKAPVSQCTVDYRYLGVSAAVP